MKSLPQTKQHFINELIATLLVLVPIVYLGLEWSELPSTIGLHSNMNGDVDRWGSKNEIVPFAFVPLAIHIILFFISFIKSKRLNNFFVYIKLPVLIIITVTIILLLHTIIGRVSGGGDVKYLAFGSFIIVVSPFIRGLKPNYFVGIRLPWTLNNENVWKESHIFASRLLPIVGILIILISLTIKDQSLNLLFLLLISLSVFVMVIFSYFIYKRNQKE